MEDAMSVASELSTLVPELWSANFYPTIKQRIVFNQSVATDYDEELNNLGDTIHVNSFPQFDEAEDLAETAVSEADSITASRTSIVVNHQLVKDYVVTYLAEVQALPVAARLQELAIYAIQKKMQKILIADTVASASAPDHQISYASGTTLALADILGPKELLDTQNVEEVGRQMIVGAAQLNDLFNITGFTSRDYIDSNAMKTGGLSSEFLGFQLKWSTEAGNTAYFFHPLYMQMVIQRAPKVGVYDLGVNGKRANRFNFTALMGNKQMSDIRVVEVS